MAHEEQVIKPLFAKGPSLGIRLLVFAVLSAVLMVVDARFETLKPMRSQMGLVLTPFYWLADVPVRVWDGATQQISSRSELMAENEKLKAEALLLQRRLQKLAALTEQNVRLRELLNSAALVDEAVRVGDPMNAVIAGVDDTWEISLLRFTVEMIQKSSGINIFDFKRRGLL